MISSFPAPHFPFWIPTSHSIKHHQNMAQLLQEAKSSSAPKQSMLYASFFELPPKIPTNCPPTPNHHTPNPRAHRRALSDSSAGPTFPDFDRLHHGNPMHMFSDEVLHSSSAAPCTPSDHDSITGDKPDPNRPDPLAWSEHDQSDAQSSCNAEQRASPAAAAASMPETDSQPIIDTRRVKRIIANRKSAQRSRVRKLQYIAELERSVTKLQMEVSTLSPRVAFLDQQRSILTVGNSQLKHRIAALAQDNIFRDAHQESLKKEIEGLRRAHQQHIINKMDAMTPGDYY